MHVALVHSDDVQFAHSHMSPRTHQSIPQYSNLTPHLPLSDNTCIINKAERCQETSLIPINPHSRLHVHTDNTYLSLISTTVNNRNLCSQWKQLQQQSWTILKCCCCLLSLLFFMLITHQLPLSPFSFSVIRSHTVTKTRAAEGQ